MNLMISDHWHRYHERHVRIRGSCWMASFTQHSLIQRFRRKSPRVYRPTLR